MASCSGTSSETSHLQQIMDQRKRKRMLSNRESARRSRQRKQKQLDDLTAQLIQLSNDNGQIVSTVKCTSQLYLNIEAENSILRAQMVELNQRLKSLNDIINHLSPTSFDGGFETGEVGADFGAADHLNGFLMGNPWNLLYVNQSPIMASGDLFI
ncbi:hypothetical protein Ancab_003239 [Ancistrocladus abbreviatus]